MCVWWWGNESCRLVMHAQGMHFRMCVSGWGDESCSDCVLHAQGVGGGQDTTGQTEADRLGWYKLVYSIIEDQIRLNRCRRTAHLPSLPLC